MKPSELPPTFPPGYPRHRGVSRAEANALDRRASAEFGIPSLVLMEHASRGIARLADLLAPPGAALLALCGPGNNGGDGYGAARFLRSWGRAVEVLCCARRPPTQGDAGLEFALASGSGAPVLAWDAPQRVQEALQRRPAVVIDALFGVNFDGSRALQEPFLGWIRVLNAAPVLRLAVDVPSGLDAETGRAHPECVRAHVTATMAAPKCGFDLARDAVGTVVEVDIGLPPALHGPLRA